MYFNNSSLWLRNVMVLRYSKSEVSTEQAKKNHRYLWAWFYELLNVFQIAQPIEISANIFCFEGGKHRKKQKSIYLRVLYSSVWSYNIVIITACVYLFGLQRLGIFCYRSWYFSPNAFDARFLFSLTVFK